MPLLATDIQILNDMRRNLRIDNEGGTRGSVLELAQRGAAILARHPARMNDTDFIRELTTMGYQPGMIQDWQLHLTRYITAEQDFIRELSSLRRQNDEGEDNRVLTESYIEYFLVENRLIRSVRLQEAITNVVGANMYSLAMSDVEYRDDDLENSMSLLQHIEQDSHDEDATRNLEQIEDAIYSWIVENGAQAVFRHESFTDRVRENYGLDFLRALSDRLDGAQMQASGMPIMLRHTGAWYCAGGVYTTYLECARQCSLIFNQRTQAQPPVRMYIDEGAVDELASLLGMYRRDFTAEELPTAGDDVRITSSMTLPAANGESPFAVATRNIARGIAGAMLIPEYRYISSDDGQEDLPTIARLLNEPRFNIGDMRVNDRGEMEVYMRELGGHGDWKKVTPTAETRVNAVRVLLNMVPLNEIVSVTVNKVDGTQFTYRAAALVEMAAGGCIDGYDFKTNIEKRQKTRNQEIADFNFWQARIGKYVKARFNPEIKSPEAPLSGKEFIWLVRSAHYKCRTDEERRAPLGIELARQLSDTQMGPTLYTLVTHIADVSNDEFEAMARAHRPKRRIDITD